jgi:hypothetical protein
MKHSALLLSICVSLCACTTIKINSDDTSVVEHEAGADATALAARACKAAGQQRAEVISTVNKDAALPAGTGRQVTTFRCVGAK